MSDVGDHCGVCLVLHSCQFLNCTRDNLHVYLHVHVTLLPCGEVHSLAFLDTYIFLKSVLISVDLKQF